MRIAKFIDSGGVERLGAVDGEHIIEALNITFDRLIGSGSPGAVMWGACYRMNDVQLMAPIGANAKVFCVGYNYGSHSTEMNKDALDYPTLFMRHPDTLVGSGTRLLRPPESDQLDWEGEVGVVIGTTARRVTRESALDHVAGYTLVADNSVRDWQFHTNQATAGKNWPASGACGPWLTTPDEAGHGPFALQTSVNGERKQHASTEEMLFDVAALVTYVSTFTVLRPGDLIATGTPVGIGLREDPPRFLRPGDELEIRVGELGVLRNGVVDEPTDAQGALDSRQTPHVDGPIAAGRPR